MSRNLHAGRARLTEDERRAIDALASEGTPEALERAFREQIRLAHEKSRQARAARERAAKKKRRRR